MKIVKYPSLSEMCCYKIDNQVIVLMLDIAEVLN